MSACAAYRLRPIVVRAIRVADVLQLMTTDWPRLPSWVRDAHAAGGLIAERTRLYVRSAEGVRRAERHDWLIRGVKGELYPCHPDVFAEAYVPADAELSLPSLLAPCGELTCRADLCTCPKEGSA